MQYIVLVSELESHIVADDEKEYLKEKGVINEEYQGTE